MSRTAGSVDDILAALEGPPPTYRDLYYRWEAERWEAHAVDLTGDRRRWSRHPGRDVLQGRLLEARALVEGLRGAAAVLADSVSGEERQVFLTTQLADEARRAVFLDRFLAEVAGTEAPDAPPRPAPLLRALADSCPDAATLRADREALAAGVAVCHVVVELGFLVAELRSLLVDSPGDGLPGLEAGLTASTRDSGRHVAFGLRFLRESCSRSERTRSAVSGVLEATLPALRSALMLGPSDDRAGPAPEDTARRGMDSLRDRLASIGLQMPR